MKKRKFIISFVIIIVIMILSCLIIFDKRDEFQYKIISERIAKEINSTTKVVNSNKELLEKYRSEYNNDEIIGKIAIENSDFNMLFVQGKDNDYYLTHLINRQNNNLGTIFLDYRNNLDKSKKINIYGHNNGKSGVSFNYIMNYENKEFYEKHKRIIISSDLSDYIYEIFSIQIVENINEYIHMKVDFNDDIEWQNYINSIIGNSLYKDNIDINKIHRILTLQTCTNRNDWQFLLVNARLVEE